MVKIAVVILAVAIGGLVSCSSSKPADKNVSAPVEQVKLIAKGTNYDIAGNLVKGYVNVFEFYADW